MKTTRRLRVVTMAVTAVMACGTANAQHWCWHHRPHRVAAVVTRPAVTIHVANHFTQGERFRMVLAYLKSHSSLSVKAYAKMTGLSRVAAEAELDAFVADRSKPVTVVLKGKKKVYVMVDGHRR